MKGKKMTVLKFKAAAVRELCEHALDSKEHFAGYGDWQPAGPALMLVGDEGIYLMSNGRPNLLGPDGKTRVVYPEGMDPASVDSGTLYDMKRDVWGGDDGCDMLDWCKPIMKRLAADATIEFVEINVTYGELILSV